MVSTTCNASTLPSSTPRNVLNMTHSGQHKDLFFLFLRAFLQPCMCIGVVQSLLRAWEVSFADQRVHAQREDSRTEPMGPKVADSGIKTLSSHFIKSVLNPWGN